MARTWMVMLGLAGCDKFIALDFHPVPDGQAVDSAGPTGHDEDLDGLADDMDNCPANANLGQQDADGDLVGDACDPDGNAANEIVMFYPFVDAVQPDWLPRDGSWTFGNDVLVHKGSTGYTAIVARNGKLLTPPFVVEAKYRFDTAPENGEFSISAALDANAKGIFCTLIRRATESVIYAYTPLDARSTVKMPPLDFGATFTARMVVAANRMTCIITSSLEGATAATANPASIPAGAIGLEGKLVDSTTQYVIVYR